MKVTDVYKTYTTSKGQLRAIEGLSCSVNKGTFITIVGPSGCGKSTFLKILAGLLPYDAGEVIVDGTVVQKPLGKKVGMVFQKPLLMPWLRVIDNVLFPLTILGEKATNYKEKAMDLLEMVRIKDFADRYPFELSGGMQQRVAICRALIYDPELLLMDEPFGALDAMTRDILNLELLRLWETKRKTIIFVTHSIQEAVFLADQVFVMTKRPAKIKEIVPIDLPRPRSMEAKGQSKYGEYVVYVYKLLQHEFKEGKHEL